MEQLHDTPILVVMQFLQEIQSLKDRLLAMSVQQEDQQGRTFTEKF
jgi:hypothetical protein